MATRQYRIHFMASFDHTVPASNDDEARKIASELQQSPGVALKLADTIRCDYAITRIDDE